MEAIREWFNALTKPIYSGRIKVTNVTSGPNEYKVVRSRNNAYYHSLLHDY